MSYTELDAWIDEKSLGDWPFSRWSVGSLPLRAGFDYFRFPTVTSGLGSIHHRLTSALGQKSLNVIALRELLDAVIEVVDSAIENSDADAYESWYRHDVWLPVLDDSLNGVDSPADMLAQSLDYIGTPDGFSEKDLSAALGLWLVGEFLDLPDKMDFRHAEILVQIGISIAETELYRGLEEGRNQEIQKLSKRTRVANDARHAANRARLTEAEQWWVANGNGRMSQAEAARQIAARFHVVEDVAKRYVRGFLRRFGTNHGDSAT